MPLIYIVEDDVNIREIQRYALKNSGFDVQEFECGKELYQALEKKIPNLILLDIMLPEEDGLEILAALRSNAATARIPIIMVTAKSTELDKVKGLDLGADDYMTKPFGIMELISRVKALLRRTESLRESSLLTNGFIEVDTDKRSVMVNKKVCELTFKEFELLRMLLVNQGIVLSREKIMEQIWGFDYEGESRTVDMHIKTLRQKLGDGGSAIKTVRNVGYVLGR
ncbi:two-component system, OmpR family, alkaline phosphatase synthesis response regulator PhoP [Lachnospiraceae bacterium 3-1]|nr:two-component system, OmpR family, alkaline phosphatase synthesis response regulator PhoP [Lachnospiraceae bacterium 3-1]